MEFIVFKEDDDVMGFHKGDVWKVRPNGYSENMGVKDTMVVVKFPYKNQRKAKKYLQSLYVDDHEILKRAYRFTRFPKKKGLLVSKWVKRKW